MNKKIRSKYKELMLKKLNDEIKRLHQEESELETKMVLLLNDKYSKVIIEKVRTENISPSYLFNTGKGKDYIPSRFITIFEYSSNLGTVTFKENATLEEIEPIINYMKENST